MIPPHIEKLIEEEAAEFESKSTEGNPCYGEDFKYGAHTMAPALIEYGMALGVQKVINSLSGHHCAECGGGQHYPMKDRFAPELSRLSPAGEEK